MLNTCQIFIEEAVSSGILSIAYYSHLVPTFISFVLIVFIASRARNSIIGKIFIYLMLFFSFWLVGDVVLWTNSNYHLITAIWSILDYINIIFFLLGLYFFIVLITGKDLSSWKKIALFSLSLPAWYITFTNKSIVAFNEPVCEALNNGFLTNYKFTVETAVVAFIMFFGLYHVIRTKDKQKRKQVALVGFALVLFFLVFSSTEFIASQTGIYEINLYSLFVLPFFLIMIIYSVTNLKIFQLKHFGMQLLVYVLLIMVGSQFFFLENTTDRTLTGFTFVISLIFSYFLTKSIKREQQARDEIERLAGDLEDANEKLKGLDKLKTEFLSLASHQLRSPLTAIKGYTSMVLDGTYGEIKEEVKEPITRVYQSTEHLVKIVEDLLNVSKIEQGGMVFNMQDGVDFSALIKDVFGLVEVTAKQRNLGFELDIKEGDYKVTMDQEKMRQVVLNLMDNSIKYTKEGAVTMKVYKPTANTIRFEIKDTGMGVSEEIKQKLFQKFSRGDGARMNTSGSGLGLYLAKEIVAAHKGNIWVESEGTGKGSTFIIELFQK